MNGLIRASLNNKYAVTVFVLTVVTIGVIAAAALPVDILPPFKSPAVQVLTFYGGMPASAVENECGELPAWSLTPRLAVSRGDRGPAPPPREQARGSH